MSCEKVIWKVLEEEVLGHVFSGLKKRLEGARGWDTIMEEPLC